MNTWNENPKLPQPGWFICWVLILILVAVAWVLALQPIAHASEVINADKLADAIYMAEGGAKAQYAYGIRSIEYKTIPEARRICINTIRNNIKRFAKQNKYKTYLEFLASRYCPINCDNDRGTNKYWLKNVSYFYARSK